MTASFLQRLKTLPNQLTFLRLASVPVLWALAILHLKIAFAVVLAIAGLTDALDGYFARKLRIASAWGAKFDSLADNTVGASMIAWIWLLLPDMVHAHPFSIALVIILFVLTVAICLIKFGTTPAYHLYTNKLGALLLYPFVICSLVFGINEWFFYATISIITLGLLEEIAMTLALKQATTDRKSVFR